MQMQVAGPSRSLPCLDSGGRSFKERQRLLSSQQKAERVLGASAPASFLKFDPESTGVEVQNSGYIPIILNSPVSSSPQSFLPWSISHPENSAPCTPSYVAPLNFKRRPRKKSLSLTTIETDMTDYILDTSTNITHRADVHCLRLRQKTYDPTLLPRRQSLPDPSLQTEGSALKRQPRPLPPVPLSRPVSPTSSISSYNSHTSPRPLPTPPAASSASASTSTTSPITFTPPSPQNRSLSVLPPTLPPLRTAHLLPPSLEVDSKDEALSPLSPASSIVSDFSDLTDLSILCPNGTGPRSPRGNGPAARKRQHVHASPYKLARSPTRYSTTSLSSQVSVPPMPPPSELRRRNRDKMAKLIRVLGESPPSGLVFAEQMIVEEPSEMDESIETPSKAKSTSKVNLLSEPLKKRSPSTGSDSSDIESAPVFATMKKSLSDPEAGHGERPESPPAARSTTPSSFLRLRSKIGRTDNDKAPRYVLSLFNSPDPSSADNSTERVTFKLNNQPPKARPTGSYLRSAYKVDVKPVEEVPPLPPAIFTLDQRLQGPKWIREAGNNRWTVDDYENVVMSLRKL